MGTEYYAYRFRLYPTANQRVRLGKNFGACRFVYNYFLDRRVKQYKEEGKKIDRGADSKVLTALKKKLPWLAEANAQALQQSLRRLDKAFRMFFTKKSAFPKFHSKKKSKESFKIPQHIKISDGRLFFSTFRDGIRLRKHREIQGAVKSVTISRNRQGQYHVGVLVIREIEELPKLDKVVGIDLGVNTLVATSDGSKFENRKVYKKYDRRLKKLQRAASRKKVKSRSRARANKLVAKLYGKMARIRRDYIQKLTTHIIRENQVICVESLNISGLARNHRAAASVNDACLGEIVRLLEKKAKWYGREVIKIGAWFPSTKTCGWCGNIREPLKLSEREWDCPSCGVHHDRDLNAANNILREGLRLRTVGVTGMAGGLDGKTPIGEQSGVNPETESSLLESSSGELVCSSHENPADTKSLAPIT